MESCRVDTQFPALYGTPRLITVYIRDATGYYSESYESCPPSSFLFLKVHLNSILPEVLNIVRILHALRLQFSSCLVRRLSGAVGVRFKGKTNSWVDRRPSAGTLLIRPTPKWVTTMYDVITWRYGVI